jgi:uncharacterized repeat protein (TIGR02543 family)
MAQISKGVRLGYGQMSGANRPTTRTYLPDLTGIPALGSAPSTHDVTTLDDAMHVYIKGLTDVGGSMEFPVLFTPAIINAVDTAIGLTTPLEWCVEFPYPLGKRAYFIGEASKVFNESVDVDAPLTGTLVIVPKTEIKWEAAEFVLTFNTNGGTAIAPQTIKYGAKPSVPTDPTKADVDFDGWYSDVALTKAIDISKLVMMGNTTVYAKWV